MPAAPIPYNESERLEALSSLCLLDTPQDPALTLMTELAATIFKVPIAVVSLVDVGRQWFKAKVGLPILETPRDHAFCAYAIHSSNSLVILDATKDERFSDNPLVTGPPYIRFYAGIPLLLKPGLAIGTLCVIGDQPRSTFTKQEEDILQQLSTLVLARIRTLQAVDYLDPLTKLPNRARFEDDLKFHFQNSPALTAPMHAAVADVCSAAHYRSMMNALGADYTDQFVLAAKDRLVKAIYPAQLYRVDTATFGFMLTRDHAEQLMSAMDILSSINNHAVELNGIPQLITYSIGIARLRANTTASEMLRLLFAAAEQAREQNRIFSFYEIEQDQSRKRSFSILAALTEALRAEGQLSLHYQPQIDLKSGRCCGVEALLRWRHPLFGHISPAEFIPMAEKTALMKRITRWVLQSGLRQAYLWQKAGHTFKLALNVSALDLDRANFVEELEEFIKNSGADPTMLELEFTEGAISANPDRVYERLTQIRHLGVNLAIDDFGTGYSNLNYLKNIPASSLKIDQSFIRSIFIDHRDSAIVQAMINLGHDLGFRILAEGVETEQSFAQLKSWGCDEAQGYWMSKPLTPAEFEKWIASKPHN